MAFVTFGLIVDDLVHADGSLALAQLGGGGPQTAFGALLHPSSPAVGLAASAGDDLPPGCAAWLRAAGVDTRGVLRTGAKPTPRAWQETGADGLRRQSWRSPPAEASDLYPPLSSLPPDYGRAVCYHAGVHPNRPGLERLASLRAAAAAAASARAGGCAGGLLSVETYTGADAPLGARELALLCCAGHVFSPNEAEARSLLEGGVLPGGGRAPRPPPPAIGRAHG